MHPFHSVLLNLNNWCHLIHQDTENYISPSFTISKNRLSLAMQPEFSSIFNDSCVAFYFICSSFLLPYLLWSSLFPVVAPCSQTVFPAALRDKEASFRAMMMWTEEMRGQGKDKMDEEQRNGSCAVLPVSHNEVQGFSRSFSILFVMVLPSTLNLYVKVSESLWHFVSVRCSRILILLNGGQLCTAPHPPEVSQMSSVVVFLQVGKRTLRKVSR